MGNINLQISQCTLNQMQYNWMNNIYQNNMGYLMMVVDIRILYNVGLNHYNINKINQNDSDQYLNMLT